MNIAPILNYPIKSIQVIGILLLTINTGWSQNEWPREIESKQGKITLYQPQPESFEGNSLKGRAAFSLRPPTKEPIFGALWMDTKVTTDRNTRIISMVDAKVTAVKFPHAVDSVMLMKFKTLLETEIVKWNLQLSLDDLLTTLDLNAAGDKIDTNLKMEAPEIIISPRPAVLVLVDGEPKLEKIKESSIQRVMNSPYFIAKDVDGKFYLNAGEKWYAASALTAEWKLVGKVSKEVKKQEENYSEGAPEVQKDSITSKTEVLIIVRTTPAELITTDGDLNFTPIQGTELLYVRNTPGNLFMDINTQEYFTLISGRWYVTRNLKGNWTYIASDKLPKDFANIPEGSEKDIVLASVAGTPAAKEALLDAQVPQTAAVDRKSAKLTVKYDGDPKFEKIEGTTLSYAVNTTSAVILSDKTYFVCENAVWFQGTTPSGPWMVSTSVPKDVQKIPPSSPVYNVKYVYIYDSTPEVVYVGYTPGYVGCYAYGPTVVYGTGYYYNPWYGPYYYPRPVTYGMAMGYNPYMGWSVGVSIHVGVGYGGWYGPPMYHPPYYPPHHPPCYGHGGNNVFINNGNINTGRNNNINNGRNNNIYNNHQSGVRPTTLPSNGTSGNGRPANIQGGAQGNNGRPSTQPSDNTGTGGPRNNANNNVQADRNGNVYQKQGQGWQENNGGGWQDVKQNTNDLDRQQGNRDRGVERSNNFSQMSGGGFSGGRGGGGRRR